MEMAYAAGVDVGSTQTKAVLINEEGRIVGRSLTDTGANVIQAAERAHKIALEDAGVDEREVEYVVGTGYGRYKVTFGNAQVTEISCHGRGAVHMFPDTRPARSATSA
jgi:activator of 2-hydroxyglutaryl-CoA dehydratase